MLKFVTQSPILALAVDLGRADDSDKGHDSQLDATLVEQVSSACEAMLSNVRRRHRAVGRAFGSVIIWYVWKTVFRALKDPSQFRKERRGKSPITRLLIQTLPVYGFDVFSPALLTGTHESCARHLFRRVFDAMCSCAKVPGAKRTTCVAIGGPNLDILFITTAR